MPAPIIQPVKSTEDLSNFDLKGQDQTLENVKYNPPPGTEPWDRDF
jgi:hypothetical protein